MIRAVTITNHLNEEYRMELGKPEKSGFNIYNISGIGPGKADIRISELGNYDGAYYNAARYPSRNIVLSLTFWGDDAESIRHQSYRCFPIKSKILLSIETDKRILSISGYIESNEPTIFSKIESTQISIICPDPYFYSNTISELVIPIKPLAITTPLLYEGDGEVGPIVTITNFPNNQQVTTNDFLHIANTSLGSESMNLSVYKIHSAAREAGVASDWTIRATDQIVVNSKKNEKGIFFIRDGKSANVLSIMPHTTKWLRLKPGQNDFICTAYNESNKHEHVGRFPNVTFTVNNAILYSGV